MAMATIIGVLAVMLSPVVQATHETAQYVQDGNNLKPMGSATHGRARDWYDLTLWYESPATDWMTEMLPIGNGRLGAMIDGGIARDRIQFNEDSLWSGDENVSGIDETMGQYEAFGNLYVSLPSHEKAENYRRELDLGEAVARTCYQSGGIHFQREYFSSHPDQVLVVRLSADKPAAYTGSIELAGMHGEKTVAKAHRLIASGSLPNGMQFESQVLVLSEGGSLQTTGDKVAFKDCNSLTLLIAAGTDYLMDSEKNWRGDPPHDRLVRQLQAASAKPYGTLKSAHTKDYKSLFDRVKLDLGPASASQQALPTNRRRLAYRTGQNDPGLETLFFQFGRYLLISSSRPRGLPANLQGLWNDKNSPPWHSDYHSNINVQMNYWPAEAANLPECHEPFLDLIRSQLKPWREASSNVYLWNGSYFYLPKIQDSPWGETYAKTYQQHWNTGPKRVRGWTVRTSHNISGGQGWKWNKPGSAWYCQHLWEHYAFSQDKVYLKDFAYPIIKEVCEFWEDCLKTLPDGSLVVPNGWSPEHGPTEDGVTYDQEIIWDLFTNYIEAADALGIDKPFRDKVAAMREKLVKPRVGRWGQLQEWMVDRDDPKGHHRHVSHMFGVYPGRQISPLTTPELATAARKSLDARGETGEGYAWSAAWKINLWARLFDAERAYRMLHTEISDLLYDNMISAGPFQLDGGFGGPAGMCEMLLQSHTGQLHLLPALPKTWPSGSVTGLRARGGFQVDIQWEGGDLVSTTIRGIPNASCQVRYREKVVGVNLATKGSVTLDESLTSH